MGFGGELVFDEEFAGHVEYAGGAELEAGEVDFVTGLGAAEPCEAGGIARGRGALGIGELCFEGGAIEVLAGGQGDGFDEPIDVAGGEGFAFEVLPCAVDAILDAAGEDEAVGRGAVVVFSGADVAAGAIEMDVHGPWGGELAVKAGEAGEIGVGNAGAVVALRMSGVVGEDGQGFVVVPEGDEGDDGIDGAFGSGAQVRIGAGGVADADDFSIRTEDAAVGGDFLNVAFAEAEVGDWLGAGEGEADGALEMGEDLALPITFEFARVHACLFEDLFGGEIAVGGIVLVEGMESDAAGVGSGGFGEAFAKGVVAFVGDADPIDGAKDDGPARAEENDAACAEAEIPFIGDGVVSHEGADGRGDIDIESGEAEGGIPGGAGRGDGEPGAGDEREEAVEDHGKRLSRGVCGNK